VTRIITEHQG